MCGVCACGCAWVCAGVHRCAWVCASMRGYARVCAVVHKCAWVCVGMRGFRQVCAGVCRFAQVRAGVCVDMHGCMHVCGMNFQDFFWRIESLHQRTLIRFLYEFLLIRSLDLVKLHDLTNKSSLTCLFVKS